MTSPGYHLWTLLAGIHELSEIDAVSTILKEVSREKNSHWMELLSGLELMENNLQKSLKELIRSYNVTYPTLEEKTPLALFVSCPQIFFELFWPYARERLGREYYILKFDSPLMVGLNFVYELSVTPDDKLDIPMIYLGSLSDRVPILTATVNDTRESIVPYESLVSIVKLIIEKNADWALIKEQLAIGDAELERLVREVLTISKPQFVEFDITKYTKENLVIVTLTAVGSLLEDQGQESNDQKNGISESINRTFSSLYKGFCRVLRICFDVPLREPMVHLQIYPKSSSASHWTYVYAPDKYHLQKDSVLSRCKQNVLEDNSPNNPALLSYRLGRKEATHAICPLDVRFNIQIPQMDSIWLNTIDKLLLLFIIVWFLACLKYLLPIPQILGILELAFSIVTYPAILESTFALIGFVLLARSWFFHESTVYKTASLRFAALLLLLTILCLLFVSLCTLNNCLANTTIQF